jgi:hypothetical protein
MGVKIAFASVYPLQSNGTVENANMLIFIAIKVVLENQLKGKWAVWSHNTSICRVTKFTPFKLLYGKEPITPEEIKLRSTKTKTEAICNPTKVESKDLLGSEHMKAVNKLQSY